MSTGEKLLAAVLVLIAAVALYGQGSAVYECRAAGGTPVRGVLFTGVECLKPPKCASQEKG